MTDGKRFAVRAVYKRFEHEECLRMNHSVRLRDYRGVTENTVRRLPDGRRLVTGVNQPATVVDLDSNEMTVSSSELMALIAISEMPFPKRSESTDWLDAD